MVGGGETLSVAGGKRTFPYGEERRKEASAPVKGFFFMFRKEPLASKRNNPVKRKRGTVSGSGTGLQRSVRQAKRISSEWGERTIR